MEEKPYRLGLLVGRFQMLHLGHANMIETALRLCEKAVLLVGSSQESDTFPNPFSYEQRFEMLKMVFPERVDIFPLPDIHVGNNALWGEYVLETVLKHEGCLPDLFVSGRESRRSSWFEGPSGGSLTELYLPKTVPLSASMLRGYFLEDDRAAWEAATLPALIPLYEQLRDQVRACRDRTETGSI